MMTRQEMVDEQKESEGDPHTKGQRQQKGREIAMAQMLQDVAKADAPSEVLSECVSVGGQVPLPFELGVSTDSLTGNERLIVSARIESGGELLWITDTAYVVDASNLPTDPMTITVAQVGGSV
jgi:uncharacterized lipoprotein YbaY